MTMATHDIERDDIRGVGAPGQAERLQLPYHVRREMPLTVSARTHDLDIHKQQRYSPEEEPDDQNGDDRQSRPREEQPAAVENHGRCLRGAPCWCGPIAHCAPPAIGVLQAASNSAT